MHEVVNTGATAAPVGLAHFQQIYTRDGAQNLSGLKFEAPVFVSVIDLLVSPEADFHKILDRLLAEKIGAAA